MDVTEDYLGVFPKTLNERIKQSDSFVLILPKSGNYDYLCDPDNWVHKEIKYALVYRDAINKPSRIVPVTFDRDFSFPSKESLGDIAEIADYSFTYYDTNNPDMANRLISALGVSKRVNPKFFWILSAILLLSIGIWKLSSPIKTDGVEIQPEYPIEESREFSSAMHRFCSLQELTDSAHVHVNVYLQWYLGQLTGNGKDTKTNTEFNEAYVKEYCLRLIVMTFLTYSNGSLDQSFDNKEIDMYVEKCYNNIPDANRYPISLKQKSNEERERDMETIVNNSIDLLNADARLSSIDETMLPIFRSTLLKAMWPSSFRGL